MSLTKAAVVQAAPVLFDTPKTLSKLAELARDAAGRGAELVVFPEAFVGGYPKGLDFGARLGTRSPECHSACNIGSDATSMTAYRN